MSAQMDRETSLTRLTIRLTHLADASDPEISRLLKKLRHVIKAESGSAELDSLSDQLARHMILREEQVVDDVVDLDLGHYAKDFADSIRSLNLDKSHRTQLDMLATQISNATHVKQQLQSLHEVFKLLSSSSLKGDAKKPSAGGVLSWFEKKNNKTDPVLEEFLTKSISLLDQILNHVDVLNGNASETRWIKDQLGESDSVDAIGAVLGDVIDLLVDITGKVSEERLTTQSFLGDLRNKLQSVEEAIFSVITDGDDSYTRAAQLESEVSNDVQIIGKAVEENDLEVLKKTVEKGLSNLSTKVANYLETERKHHIESKEKIHGLTLQVRDMEAEASNLKSEVRIKQDLAVKDPLTGVYNRAGYEERVQEEFARSSRTKAPLSIVFVDCNKFKQINDTFGHNAGDVVLMKVAETLKKRARVSDIVARYGGDEFVVLLPDTGLDGAKIFAVGACEKVKQAGFNNNGTPLDVSISCGVTQIREDDSPVTALHRADQAMYAAKKETDEKVIIVE